VDRSLGSLASARPLRAVRGHPPGRPPRPLTAYSPKSRRPIADSFRRTAPAVVRLCLASIPGSSSSRRDSATFGSDSTCSTAW